MPEGNRRTPIDIDLEYDSFTESNIEGIHVYSFFISGENFLELPLDANVRAPTEKSIPYKEMVRTLEESPQDFFLQNNGISVVASSVKVNKSKNSVEFNFQPDTGIMNGGHTQLAIIQTKKKRDISKATIKLDVVEQTFSASDLARIAASKNTASNVKPYSTAEKKGYFLKIKKEMLPKFEKHIIWYENRPVPNDRGILATDLIAILNLFNVLKHQSSYKPTLREQPNKSSTSKASVFKDWENDQNNYLHTYPLVDDIINLNEHIISTFHKNIPRGFTSLSVVKNLDGKKRKSIFLGKSLRFELPKQFLMPLLASVRAGIDYDDINNKIAWFEKPEDLFDKCKKDLITDLLRTYKSTYHNEINRASKDTNLWTILYSDVEKKVDRSGKRWKTYDIPR